MKNNLIKNIAACALLLAMALSMSACGHQHTWTDATYTAPKTCTECGETEGEALSHSQADQADAAMAAAEEEQHLETAAGEEAESESVSDYFATARLTRQKSRDQALELLAMAADSENSSQETIYRESLAAVETWAMQETQLENLIMKDFADCVVYISDVDITVKVFAPSEGLSEDAVARITDTVTGETDYTASQIRLIEIKNESVG